MANSPLFSIIIATYNRATLLPRAIKSVVNQSYDDFELIIINDGSTDNTHKVVSVFNDNRIIYAQFNNNKGALAAKNKGFALSRGKYSIRLDDDDILLPNALEIVASHLHEMSKRDVQMLQFNIVDSLTGKYCGSGIRTPGYITYEDMLCGKIKGDYCKVLDLNLVKDKYFDERPHFPEGLLWLKLHKLSPSYYIPETIYIANRNHGFDRRTHRGNRLENIEQLKLAQEVFINEFGNDLKRYCPRYYGIKLMHVGSLQLISGDKDLSRQTLLRAFNYKHSFKSLVLILLTYINSNKIRKYVFSAYYWFMRTTGK
jgi:glycosyltransferase involved in cell wall biosynthesis